MDFHFVITLINFLFSTTNFSVFRDFKKKSENLSRKQVKETQEIKWRTKIFIAKNAKVFTSQVSFSECVSSWKALFGLAVVFFIKSYEVNLPIPRPKNWLEELFAKLTKIYIKVTKWIRFRFWF